jgi:hypothetical protein
MHMDSLAAHVVDLAWLPAAFILLGAAGATWVVRRLNLPGFFWLPLVFGSASLVSYGVFYVWFFDSPVGHQVSVWILIAAALLFAWQCTDRAVRQLLAQRDVWLPGLLMLLVMIAYACLLAWPQVTANYRFRIPLPPEDNNAPRALADRMEWRLFQQGTPPPIMDHGYRSSDRPPLQTGITLALRPWQPSSGDWAYESLGLFCQLGWIPALYALARTIRLTRRQLAMVLIGCTCSGFFFLNSIYTWPKLLAAALFLSALALLLYLIQLAHAREDRDPPETAGILRVSTALTMLALLAHGGPFFSLIALPILLLPLRPWPRLRTRDAILAIAMAASLLAPWLAYQRFYDPPGDRLWKIHFAGLPQDDFQDTRPFLRALREEYARLTPGQYLAGRWSNVKEQFLVFGKAPTSEPIYWGQWQQFIHHLPALDVLLIGFLGLLTSRARPDIVRRLAVYAFVALFIWLLLLLAPESALMHHGSYATAALLFFCASAGLAMLPVVVSWGVMALHVALFAWIWAAAWPNQPPPAAQQGNPLYLLGAALALIAFAIGLRLAPADA